MLLQKREVGVLTLRQPPPFRMWCLRGEAAVYQQGDRSREGVWEAVGPLRSCFYRPLSARGSVDKVNTRCAAVGTYSMLLLLLPLLLQGKTFLSPTLQFSWKCNGPTDCDPKRPSKTAVFCCACLKAMQLARDILSKTLPSGGARINLRSICDVYMFAMSSCPQIFKDSMIHHAISGCIDPQSHLHRK